MRRHVRLFVLADLRWHLRAGRCSLLRLLLALPSKFALQKCLSQVHVLFLLSNITLIVQHIQVSLFPASMFTTVFNCLPLLRRLMMILLLLTNNIAEELIKTLIDPTVCLLSWLLSLVCMLLGRLLEEILLLTHEILWEPASSKLLLVLLAKLMLLSCCSIFWNGVA